VYDARFTGQRAADRSIQSELKKKGLRHNAHKTKTSFLLSIFQPVSFTKNSSSGAQKETQNPKYCHAEVISYIESCLQSREKPREKETERVTPS